MKATFSQLWHGLLLVLVVFSVGRALHSYFLSLHPRVTTPTSFSVKLTHGASRAVRHNHDHKTANWLLTPLHPENISLSPTSYNQKKQTNKNKKTHQMKFNLESFGKGKNPLLWVTSLRGVRNKRLWPELCRGLDFQPPAPLTSTLLIISMVGSCRCESCGAVFHAECKEKSVPCPRCVRRELQMKQKSFWRRLNMDESLEEACNMFELSYQNTWLSRSPRPGGDLSTIHQPQWLPN